ncbi:hypothetical protein [Chroococcidiopsis sp. CCNUC1]|uniref:hypothetical protein n=1 Tax=Chroococcidiopsis sp. CCNUC1 TaxID=2653189 RepID=UPI0020214543|nr:hypothetical protein [Chroococcidiopsis sp. CCNUC1]URD49192.1 hypothetical protein M5J74_23055 [Chroococcidiopsis sp. CCNUC1]
MANLGKETDKGDKGDKGELGDPTTEGSGDKGTRGTRGTRERSKFHYTLHSTSFFVHYSLLVTHYSLQHG